MTKITLRLRLLFVHLGCEPLKFGFCPPSVGVVIPNLEERITRQVLGGRCCCQNLGLLRAHARFQRARRNPAFPGHFLPSQWTKVSNVKVTHASGLNQISFIGRTLGARRCWKSPVISQTDWRVSPSTFICGILCWLIRHLAKVTSLWGASRIKSRLQ